MILKRQIIELPPPARCLFLGMVSRFDIFVVSTQSPFASLIWNASSLARHVDKGSQGYDRAHRTFEPSALPLAIFPSIPLQKHYQT